jgi:hypothetical protein
MIMIMIIMIIMIMIIVNLLTLVKQNSFTHLGVLFGAHPFGTNRGIPAAEGTQTLVPRHGYYDSGTRYTAQRAMTPALDTQLNVL